MNNWNGKKKVLVLAVALFMVVGLVATIFIVQKKQETRSHAEKATTLTLTPPTQNAVPDGNVNLNVNINPGTNQVNFVTLVIKFDPAKFDSPSTTFTPDSSTSLKMVGQPAITSGQITVNLSTPNPINAITTPQKLGALSLKVGPASSVTSGDTKITFDETLTQVRSVVGGTVDPFSLNVLLSTEPATVTIQAECKPNVSTCSWDAVDGATKYHFTVTDEDGKQVIDGKTSNTSAEFPSEAGKTYKCSVEALNDCGGVGLAGDGTSTCATPSASPSPTLIPSVSPSVSPTLTLTPTPVPSATPTPTTPGSSVTPTPTTPGGATATPTPTTVITNNVIPTPTTTPKLPPTGSPLVVGGILGGILVLLGGLALLIL